MESNKTIAEQYYDACLKVAEKKNEAIKCKKIMERTLAECSIRSGEKTSADKNNKALLNPVYIQAESAYVEAQSQANIAQAEADGIHKMFEEWRTNEATKRAEMQLR